MPYANRVHFRQDNAGCYHSASTLLGIQQVAKKYELNFRLDFSSPQGGKGLCGQDVETAGQMKNAM